MDGDCGADLPLRPDGHQHFHTPVYFDFNHSYVLRVPLSLSLKPQQLRACFEMGKGGRVMNISTNDVSKVICKCLEPRVTKRDQGRYIHLWMHPK